MTSCLKAFVLFISQRLHLSWVSNSKKDRADARNWKKCLEVYKRKKNTISKHRRRKWLILAYVQVTALLGPSTQRHVYFGRRSSIRDRAALGRTTAQNASLLKRPCKPRNMTWKDGIIRRMLSRLSLFILAFQFIAESSCPERQVL